MRIDGITTCAGEQYAGYLARSLPVWLDTLDSVTVVGLPNEIDRLWYGFLCEPSLQIPVQVVSTDAFTSNGASFNKGAALNYGIRCNLPTRSQHLPSWLLSFDCDILPPANWREIAERQLERGNLYGAPRYSPEGGRVDRRWYPRGYFQLWHVTDPHYRRSPVFDENWPDAGGYDTAFASQWPLGKWVDLGIALVHQGEKAKHWCGPGGTAGQNREAVRRAIERQARAGR